MPIFIDSETLDFFGDPHIKPLPRPEQLKLMRLGVVVTFDGVTWREWFANDVRPRNDDLMELWAMLAAADLVVGWNILAFDLIVLAHHAAGQNQALPSVRAFDLFDEIKQTTQRWYSLERIAQANLGRDKRADGQRAAEWLRSGDEAQIALAVDYCRDDVRLVADLYDRAITRGQPLHLPGLDRDGQREPLDLDLRQEDGLFRLIQSGV